MVDGYASMPALRQDTGYMVEKTYLDIAPYLGAFGVNLMVQKVFPYKYRSLKRGGQLMLSSICSKNH